MKEYRIVPPSAIIIGNLGLDKIIFYPAPDTTKCKFKIVINKDLFFYLAELESART